MSDGAMDLALLPALELRRLIDDGDVSAREVAAACLARIKAADPPIQSFVTLVDEERVMVTAENAQRQIRQGAALPLAGIPYALKDLTETAGIRTTFGSRLRKNHVPNEDAAVARRLREAGGVLLGKTNTPEFGNRATTAQSVGPRQDSWRLERRLGRRCRCLPVSVRRRIRRRRLNSDSFELLRRRRDQAIARPRLQRA